MKKRYLILLQIILSVLLVSSISFATPVIDGVMGNDWNGWQTVEDAVGTNGYVGPGWGGQAFDVEKIGLFIDGSTLYFGLQTGFDITGDNTITYGGSSYEGGDFALDFGSDGSFEFGLDWNYGTVDLYQVSSWTDPYFTDSKPWKISSYTQKLSTSNDSTDAFSHDITAVFASVTDSSSGDTHYTLEGSIDLSVLTAALQNIYGTSFNFDSVTAHWTMSCGNDVLETTAHMPEPATLLLFGMGLLGAGAYGRKRAQKEDV